MAVHPVALLLFVVGIVLVLLIILQLAGVPLPGSTGSDDYDTEPSVPVTADDQTEPPIPDNPVPAAPPTPTGPVPPGEPRYVYKGLLREFVVCSSLEEIYHRGFPTVRPDWLRNPVTGQRMEYDCYNADLKIAAEHNGEHHYIYPNTFHRSEQEFLAQRARDLEKRRLSDEHGVYQIIVPYWVPTDMIKEWVHYYCPEQVAQRERIARLAPPRP